MNFNQDFYITLKNNISCEQICQKVGKAFEQWQKENPQGIDPIVKISICNISHTIDTLPRIENKE